MKRTNIANRLVITEVNSLGKYEFSPTKRLIPGTITDLTSKVDGITYVWGSFEPFKIKCDIGAAYSILDVAKNFCDEHFGAELVTVEIRYKKKFLFWKKKLCRYL